MRSPVIAFSILAAAVSPTLVAGAPTSPNPDSAVSHAPRQLSNAMNKFDGSGLPVQPPVQPPSGLPVNPLSNARKAVDPPSPTGIFGGIFGGQNTDAQTSKPDPSTHRQAEQQLHNPSSSSIDTYTSHAKRASDMNSAGGNSYTGATSDTSGGSVVNVAHGGGDGGEEGGDEGIDNDAAVTAGFGGDGYSGFSYGGDGDGKGAGGNAYSGAVGPSEGGDVINASDYYVDNEDTDTGGAGGFDESGDANGGDAAGNIVDGVDTSKYSTRRKRAQDSGTAGGNGYSGATSDVDGGNVINHADNDGYVYNDGAQAAGDAGETYSGEATGGDGDGFGPGGNAYTGATGSAVGGSVVSQGGEVENEATIDAGNGGESESGDAQGGDA